MKVFIRYALVSSLMLISAAAFSQNITLGFNMQENNGELLSNDPTFDDGRHYKNLTFSMKAGESVLLYMVAATFNPAIYAVDTNMQNWVLGHNETLNGNYASVLWFQADRDTSFFVVYSSATTGQSGNFIYGFRNLKSDQQDYTKAASNCDRLYYLINNWQLFMGFLASPTGETTGLRDCVTTYIPGDTATISNMSSYNEYLYVGVDGEKAYTQYVTEINSCMNAEQWNISEESFLEEITGTSYLTTFFTVPNAINGQALNSFSIGWESDPLGNDKVYLQLH